MSLIENNLKKALNEMLTLAEISKKKTVFTIGIAPRKREPESIFFPFVRESSLSVIGNVEIDNLEDAKKIVTIIDGIVDYILIDDEKKSDNIVNLSSELKNLIKDSIVLTYKDNDAWVEAADVLINQFLEDNLNKNILIFTINNLSLKLALKLCERGSNVYILDEKISDGPSLIKSLNFMLPENCPSHIYYHEILPKSVNIDVVIGYSIDKVVINSKIIKEFSPKTIIFDAGIGSISKDAIEYALDNNFTIFRLDMRAGLSGNIINVIETYDLKNNVYGRKKFRNYNIVAGGFFGLLGDVVVDSIKNPTRVIGIADGKGHLMASREIEKYKARIREVEKEFIRFIK